MLSSVYSCCLVMAYLLQRSATVVMVYMFSIEIAFLDLVRAGPSRRKVPREAKSRVLDFVEPLIQGW